jgi:hypothetical protein
MPHEWNNLIVVTADELVPAFFNSLKTLQKSITRYEGKSYGIKRVQKGGNGRPMLIAFDSLPKEMQEAIGDPRKITNPLEIFYKQDQGAVDFYTTFSFEDESGLSLKHIEEYITNASVLRAAILLKEAREYERRTKGGSLKGVMSTICNDVILFNKVLTVKHRTQHTLPASEKRFKETFKEFANGFNYASLISAKLRNENRKIVTDELLNFLNDLFAEQAHKPTRTEIAKQYTSFLSGYLEVINTTTGEMYDPKNFKPLSEATIINYLNKWQDKIATHKRRSGDRQKYMGLYKTYHSLDKPTYSGSIISIDDRNPPFKYDANNRVWFYNGIDLASEAWICWVHGKSKEGIIVEFYRQLVRNFAQWGLGLPAELECELNLNSSYKNTFLQEGWMFEHVRMEANNARGKRIERYFETLRYTTEKQREGWLARPHARRESNQAGRRNAFVTSKEDELSKAPIIPYNTIVEGCLRDIEDWNNTPHSAQPEKTRWEYFLEMQHPNLKPINWRAILPHLGYMTRTSCQLNGIIHLNNKEFLLGMNGEVLLGDRLINMMSKVAGNAIDVYWLDDNNGEVLKALVFLKNGDTIICEAVPKPTYNRARIERTDKDEQNYQLISAYASSIEAYAKRREAAISEIVVIDKTPRTLNRKFVIPTLKVNEPENDVPREAEILSEEQPETSGTEIYLGPKSLKDRY